MVVGLGHRPSHGSLVHEMVQTSPANHSETAHEHCRKDPEDEQTACDEGWYGIAYVAILDNSDSAVYVPPSERGRLAISFGQARSLVALETRPGPNRHKCCEIGPDEIQGFGGTFGRLGQISILQGKSVVALATVAAIPKPSVLSTIASGRRRTSG